MERRAASAFCVRTKADGISDWRKVRRCMAEDRLYSSAAPEDFGAPDVDTSCARRVAYSLQETWEQSPPECMFLRSAQQFRTSGDSMSETSVELSFPSPPATL